MKKKYYIITLFILCLAIIFNASTVKATNDEVTDREMAIASAMSYVPLQKNKTMSQCFDIADIKLISEVVNYVNSKFNLHDYGTIHELDDWIVDDYNCLQGLKQNGLTTFRLKRDNDIIIVIRGSNSPVDAFEDIKYGIKNATIQEKYLKEYIKNTMEYYSKQEGNYNFYITGHSLGGYLAQIGGAYIEDNIKNYTNMKLARIVDFNGMGINFFTAFGNKFNYGDKKDTIETLKKIGEDGRLIEYYTYGDLVSSLGVHYGEMRELVPSIDSITYHRNNYAVLKSFGSKIIKVAEADTPFNACKTDLSNAQNFYKVGNIASYLNLTHEADVFACIETEKSVNKPEVRITDSSALISNFFEKTASKDLITIRNSTTIRATTAYASAKKYEWYENVNGEWKLIKTSTIDKNDPEYNPDVAVTNELEIDLNDFKPGEMKEYMVKSYYNDNYVASKYYINSDNKYAYKEIEGASKQEESKVVTGKITVRRARENTILNRLLKRLINRK